MPNPDPDLPNDWWTTTDVLEYLKSVGAPVKPGTWRAYIQRRQAPQPDRHFGNVPAWRPATIRVWHRQRPRVGQPPTSGGVVLTDTAVQALAGEAEAGYDLDALRARPRRP